MSYTPITNLTARALPAAGAWYTSAAAVPLLGQWSEVHGETSVPLRVTYTKGGSSSGGYPKIQVYWTVRDDAGNDQEMMDTLIDSAITIVGGVATEKEYQRVRGLVELTDGNPATTETVFSIPRRAEKIRVEAAEAGDTAHPGTITVGVIGQL